LVYKKSQLKCETVNFMIKAKLTILFIFPKNANDLFLLLNNSEKLIYEQKQIVLYFKALNVTLIWNVRAD